MRLCCRAPVLRAPVLPCSCAPCSVLRAPVLPLLRVLRVTDLDFLEPVWFRCGFVVVLVWVVVVFGAGPILKIFSKLPLFIYLDRRWSPRVHVRVFFAGPAFNLSSPMFSFLANDACEWTQAVLCAVQQI